VDAPVRVVVETGTDWPAVLSAWAALGAVVIGILTLIYQGRRMRRQLGLANMWSLIERWDQPAMRRVRARTAAEILRDWNNRSYLSGGGADILNLFELVAYLVVRSKTLDREDAWVNFSEWALKWWMVYLPAIEVQRADDFTVFEDYDALIQSFRDYAESRDLSEENINPTDAQLRSFLAGEVELVERLRYQRPLRFAPTWLGERLLASWREGQP
jgi:hypothetical protein